MAMFYLIFTKKYLVIDSLSNENPTIKDVFFFIV